MIQSLIGIDSDFIILALLLISIILFVLVLVNGSKIKKLQKKYDYFMKGSNGKSLEDTLVFRLDQVDDLIEANAANERNVDKIFANMKQCFKKQGLVKYDALNEMGGKLSFSLALLDEKDDGFILNAMHTRDGCYTYIKEIVAGNSIIALSEEETKALAQAMNEE